MGLTPTEGATKKNISIPSNGESEDGEQFSHTTGGGV